jgi:hypothetical protein
MILEPQQSEQGASQKQVWICDRILVREAAMLVLLLEFVVYAVVGGFM